MGIILRFIIRTIRQKKLRSALIIIAVTLSSALYFGAAGMSTTIQKMYGNRLRQYFGTAEIVVTGKASYFFSPIIPSEFAGRLKYAVGSVRADGQLRTDDEIAEITIHGFAFEELQEMNPVTLVNSKPPNGGPAKGAPPDGAPPNGGPSQPFSGKMAIIGVHTAEKYGLSNGDSLRVVIQGGTHRFRIVRIAESTGFLTDDGRSTVIIVPRTTLSSILDARGRVSVVYVKARDPDATVSLLEDMRGTMNRHEVQETVSREDIKQWAEDTAVPFRVMLVLTLAMSVFIIFTCFQVITMDRLPVIGTFRSIGASRKTTDAVLIAESLLYGTAGGILGSILGVGVMYLMTHLNTGGWLTQSGIELVFTPRQVVETFLLAILISTGSALVPIIRVSRLPVKDVILNTIQHSKGHPRLRIAVGFLFLASGLLTPFFVPVSIALVVDSVCILLILISVVMLVPAITSTFARVLQKAFYLLFGYVGTLAAKNLAGNRNILHNVALLAIGISSLYMIETISSSVMDSLANLYRDAKYDVQVWAWPPNRDLEMKLRTVPGVSDTYGVYGTYGVKLPNHDDTIDLMHGVDKDKFGEYWDYRTSSNREGLFAKLQSGRYIVPSNTLQRRLGLNEGDRLLLDFDGRQREYEVAGFFYSLMWNGSYALIGERFLKLDAARPFYSDLYVKTSRPPDEVAEAIQERLARRRPWVITMDEMESRDRQSNKDMFLILKGFSLMTMLIGIVGVLNNYILSFIERKRSLALLRSVGMSKKQAITMLFLEALSGGLVGGLSGLGAGLLILFIVPHLFNALRLPVIVLYSSSVGFTLMGAGILISLVASTFPALKTSKLNIIEAIRYE
jgi:putative ABC transport system permease protein